MTKLKKTKWGQNLTQIVTKLKTSNWDKTKNIKWLQKKLKKSNSNQTEKSSCDKTQL